MPFVAEDGSADPRVFLEQTGPNRWRLTQGFRYVDADGRVFPIRAGTDTDLASVPWPMWWLVASYGRHTKAVLLHDELIDPTPDYPLKVPRREADRLLFVSILESGFGDPAERKRPSWLRRWLIWSAVAVASVWAEAPVRALLFLAHLVAVWIAVAWAIGAGSTGGAAAAVVIGAAGGLWALEPHVDTRLGTRLFPTALFASVVAFPPAALAVVSTAVVWIGDLAYNLGRAVGDRDFEWSRMCPIFRPTRGRGRF